MYSTLAEQWIVPVWSRGYHEHLAGTMQVSEDDYLPALP